MLRAAARVVWVTLYRVSLRTASGQGVSRCGPFRRRGDQASEQRGVLCRLGVPLDGQPEAGLRVLERLHDAIGGPRRRGVAGMGRHPLVVVGGHVNCRRSQHAGQVGAIRHPHGMPREDARSLQMHVGPHRVRQVLVEGAPVGDSHDLHPPADPQEGQITLQRTPRERHLERVALGRHVRHRRVARLSVAGGIDVGAAGQDQGIEEIEDPIMRQVRYMDKLVDELAKGRKMEKILRTAV